MKIIIANWKMNLSVAKSLDYLKGIKPSKNLIVLAAPYTFLTEMAKKIGRKKIKLAAQNVSAFDKGAYTGEVAASMLKEVTCSYCLVGHSERRIYFKESDQEINQKIRQLLSKNIKPVLCLGENDGEHKKGATNQVLQKQLLTAIANVEDWQKILIAYEPVWAISTFQTSADKQSAQLTDIEAAHKHIKAVLRSINEVKARQVKILYGGTVKPDNVQEILSLKSVDGALVGGASLKCSDFNAIIQSI